MVNSPSFFHAKDIWLLYCLHRVLSLLNRILYKTISNHIYSLPTASRHLANVIDLVAQKGAQLKVDGLDLVNRSDVIVTHMDFAKTVIARGGVQDTTIGIVVITKAHVAVSSYGCLVAALGGKARCLRSYEVNTAYAVDTAGTRV